MYIGRYLVANSFLVLGKQAPVYLWFNGCIFVLNWISEGHIDMWLDEKLLRF